MFSSALAVERADRRHLRDQLVKDVVEAPALGTRITPFGVLYEAVVLVEGLNGARAPVAAIWIVEGENLAPRLVSTWVDIP
ncbi:hypothetical protein BH20ACT18_BH20ACT18_07460 [soil metagenome]